MNPLEPGQLSVWRVQAFGFGAVVLIAAIVGEVVRAKADLPVPPGTVIGLAVLLLIYPVLISPKKHFLAWGWKSEDEELHLHHGVFTKVETVVPFRRVQHIDVRQGALERHFHVCALVLHTAGTINHRVVLPGLDRRDAEAIRDAVRSVIARDADV